MSRRRSQANGPLIGLMRPYALRGFEDWKERTSKEIQDQARASLQFQIVESEEDVEFQISNPRSTKFLPMPNCRHRGIVRCFFMPRGFLDGDQRNLAFYLFLMIRESNNLSFRIEPADQSDHAHNYAHIQFCTKIIGRDTLSPIGTPIWIPDSYPAFPLPSSDPLGLFLAMVTAVHGRAGGIESILRKAFLTAGDPSSYAKYIEALTDLLRG